MFVLEEMNRQKEKLLLFVVFVVSCCCLVEGDLTSSSSELHLSLDASFQGGEEEVNHNISKTKTGLEGTSVSRSISTRDTRSAESSYSVTRLYAGGSNDTNSTLEGPTENATSPETHPEPTKDHDTVAEDLELAASYLDLTFFNSNRMMVAYLICVVIACILSVVDIRDHAIAFDYPKIQIYLLRVLFMIPIYGVFSFAALYWHHYRFYLDTVRDTYEALVLYMFFSLLIAYAGGEGQLIRALSKKRYKGIHLFPMCLLPLYTLDRGFFLRCKRMVLQYALFKPIAAVLACVGEPLGIYSETNFNLDNLYTYVYMYNNISISYSLYYLVLFETETEKELRYCQAGLKFLCIKSIIFFAFWQSASLSMLINYGWIYVGGAEEEKEINTMAVQNGLICLELLPVAFMHHFAFSREKLEREMAAEPVFDLETHDVSARQSIGDAMRFRGVISDLMATLFYRRSKLVNLENDDDEDDEEVERRREQAEGHGGQSTAGSNGGGSGTGVRDPTVDELVRYAFLNDKGLKPEGLLYIPESDDEVVEDDNIDYNETDIISPDFAAIAKRKGHVGVGSAAIVAAIEEEAAEATIASVAGSSVVNAGEEDYVSLATCCSVCGRFDRELVQRKSGVYKCRLCVGNSSIKAIKAATKKKVKQLETLRQNVGFDS